jgi:hypothetical protein
MAATAAATLAVLWLVVGLPARKLVRQIYKLLPFGLFIVGSYALTKEDPSIDRWVQLWRIKINLGGAAIGLLMIARVYGVVLASQVARAGDVRAIAHGLRTLGMPKTAAISIDAVLALLGGPGSGGGGGGGGGGSGGGGGDKSASGFWRGLKQLSRGEVDPIVRRLEKHIARAEEHVAAQDVARSIARDVAVISGIALTMLGIKALKVLPGINFAPGWKTVILTPLYVITPLLTRTRFGATIAGTVMGVVAFLLGDGKYGPFEILKHVAPGLICDALVPIVTRHGRMPGPIGWSLLGGVIAIGRFATILVVTALVGTPHAAYLVLIPGLVVHVSFGVASGYVSYHLVKGVAKVREEIEVSNKELA